MKKPQKPIEFEGRKFRILVEETAERRDWVRGLIHRTGLRTPQIGKDEDYDDFASRLCGEVAAAGNTFPILASLLIPMGLRDLEWSPEVAEETAAFLKQLHDPKDLSTLDGVLAAALAGFFALGLSSPRISATASGNPQARPGNLTTVATENGHG